MFTVFNVNKNACGPPLRSVAEALNNTLEERVALLEIQVDEIQEDVITTRIDLTELEGDVNFLFDEQVIQDERLLGLEDDIDTIEGQLFNIYGNIDGEEVHLMYLNSDVIVFHIYNII